MSKKPFSLNLSHLAQKQSTQSFKIEIKTIKKSFNSFFLIKKCWFLQKLQGFEVERRKGIKKVGAADSIGLHIFYFYILN